MDDDGGSVGLDGKIQLRWPIIPWPVNRTCLLNLFVRLGGSPECYVSVFTTVIFAPVGITIEGASVTVIMCPDGDISTTSLLSWE